VVTFTGGKPSAITGRDNGAVIDPHVDPVRVGDPIDGSTLVDVHQVVRDLEGNLLLDETIVHRFQFKGDLVTRFDIEGASAMSTIGH
jgi:hypothetical protein